VTEALKRKVGGKLDASDSFIERMLFLIAKTENLDFVLAAFQICEFPREILDVNTSPSVHMGRIFICQ
jgi:hypothetical protein